MIALVCFVLAALASPFKSKSRLEAENAALRHQLIVLRRRVRGRAQLTNSDRWFFVQVYRWFPSIHQVLTIIRPETLVRWHRAGFRRYWRWKSQRRGGRPQIDAELRGLIRQMSMENLLWGAPRIHGELLKLGFELAQSSVAKYMVKRRGPPSQGWRIFLRNHAPDIAAMDLFVVPTIGFKLLYGFVIVRLSRRDLVWINVTTNPTARLSTSITTRICFCARRTRCISRAASLNSVSVRNGDMQRNSQYAADALLNLLLDRFEAPRARSRDITQPIDYTMVGGPAAQDEFHRILQDAERAGGVALEQARIGHFTGEFARVRLVDPDSLYKFLVRAPATTTADNAHQIILTAIPDILADPYFQEIEQEAIIAWKGNKSFLGLSVADIDTLLSILRLTHAIIHLSGDDIDHRTFSRRIVKDSKALERVEGRVAQLLIRRDPTLAGDEPREVLQASGIVRRAHLLQVKGPLRLLSDALQIHGTGNVFIGLPWVAVQQATLAHAVDYVITIENPTSFWRYSTEIDGNYLALLTDGFPARDVLSSMAHLVRTARLMAPNTPVYHWGDIDAGGLRIAAHLEDTFETAIRLHQMEHELALTLGSPLQSNKGLEKLASRPGQIGQLAGWLRSGGAKMLEQEELDPKTPIVAALVHDQS